MTEVFKITRNMYGILVSVVISKWSEKAFFTRIYNINKITHPPDEYPDAWLMGFESLEHAKLFVSGDACKTSINEVEIYKATATKTRTIKRIARCTTHDDKNILPSFWNTVHHDTVAVPTQRSPDGTILCSDITLTERVYPVS